MKAELLSLKADDAVQDLGTVYSTDEATLRAFGKSYMNDPQTIGSLTLCDPSGLPIASFDVWTNDWKEAADNAA